MIKKPVHLDLIEDSENDIVKKAYRRAEKYADKAEKNVEKLKPHHRLRNEPSGSADRKSKLRFEKAGYDPEITKPSKGKQIIIETTMAAFNAQRNNSYSDDNAGVNAGESTLEFAENAAMAAEDFHYAHKLKSYDKAEKSVKKSDKANVDALYEKFTSDNPQASSNPISKMKQKQNIRKQYETARKSTAGRTVHRTKKTADRAKNIKASGSKSLWIILIFALLFVILLGWFSSCSTMFKGSTQIILSTSFTAEDEDILGVNDDYIELEKKIPGYIDDIEKDNPDFDEYRYNLDEIKHDPYELTAYLTVLYEDYRRYEVQSAIKEIIRKQYELRLEEETEIRTRTETRTGIREVTDPETGETYTEEYEYEVEVEYEYHILNITLINHGIDYVARNSELTDDDLARYDVLLLTKGNRPYLFGGEVIISHGIQKKSENQNYEADTYYSMDDSFSNIMREAEKYIGQPFVWGGSNPQTGFDCSGYVSWVINHCGNGWNYGRLGVKGLKSICEVIPGNSAKPGDLIFFEGTYDIYGASHVGIYVGDGMMLHCGDPIGYSSIETEYWQEHFQCFGRLPQKGF